MPGRGQKDTTGSAAHGSARGRWSRPGRGISVGVHQVRGQADPRRRFPVATTGEGDAGVLVLLAQNWTRNCGGTGRDGVGACAPSRANTALQRAFAPETLASSTPLSVLVITNDDHLIDMGDPSSTSKRSS